MHSGSASVRARNSSHPFRRRSGSGRPDRRTAATRRRRGRGRHLGDGDFRHLLVQRDNGRARRPRERLAAAHRVWHAAPAGRRPNRGRGGGGIPCLRATRRHAALGHAHRDPGARLAVLRLPRRPQTPGRRRRGGRCRTGVRRVFRRVHQSGGDRLEPSRSRPGRVRGHDVGLDGVHRRPGQRPLRRSRRCRGRPADPAGPVGRVGHPAGHRRGGGRHRRCLLRRGDL